MDSVDHSLKYLGVMAIVECFPALYHEPLDQRFREWTEMDCPPPRPPHQIALWSECLSQRLPVSIPTDRLPFGDNIRLIVLNTANQLFPLRLGRFPLVFS